MTKKEAKEIMSKVTFYWELGEQTLTQNQINEALDMAITALEQEPCNTKTYLKRREENYVEYNVEWFLKNWELELEILSGGKIKPTDADCISREAVDEYITNLLSGYLYDEERTRLEDLTAYIWELSPVQPTRSTGKWIDSYRQVVYRCSECNALFAISDMDDYSFCPNCGAEMEENENDK